MPTSARSTPERSICLLVGLLVAVWLLGFCRGHLSGSDELNVFETTRALTERGSLRHTPVRARAHSTRSRVVTPPSPART